MNYISFKIFFGSWCRGKGFSRVKLAREGSGEAAKGEGSERSSINSDCDNQIVERIWQQAPPFDRAYNGRAVRLAHKAE
jgi:hypothetical protein